MFKWPHTFVSFVVVVVVIEHLTSVLTTFQTEHKSEVLFWKFFESTSYFALSLRLLIL